MASELTTIADPKAWLRALFDRALGAVRADLVVPPHLPPPPKGRTIVVGAGKAAAEMAAAVEANWDGPLEGLVVVPYGHATTTRRIAVAEAGHPVPDIAGVNAAQTIIHLVSRLTRDDLVLALISGGGSSLLTLPATGLSLAHKQEVTRRLLASGAPISAVNTVRKHLSAIKGGRLAAAAYPARVVTLGVSDVPGNDPSLIASGPTVPDPTTGADALEIIAHYDIDVRREVHRVLGSPAGITLGAHDPRLAASEFRFVATPRMALEAAAAAAREAAIEPVNLGDEIEGAARDVAADMAETARRAVVGGGPASPPCVLISGGETTVSVAGEGHGGRNTEFALALALALGGARGIHAISCDTDGIDGASGAAGAYVGPDTLSRARDRGLDAAAHLVDNDSGRFFETLGDAIVTGPTRTNVNDFRAILIPGREDR